MERKKEESNIVVLDGVRSVLNAGSIFRTADAVKIDKIYLCGITPCPTDRFGRDRADFHKSALGAEKTVKWEYVENISELIKKLKAENFQIISVEQAKNSMDYKKVKLKNKNVFIFGNETEGISKEVLKQSDVIAEIPMGGKKESLNVGVSFGVAIYRFLNL